MLGKVSEALAGKVFPGPLLMDAAEYRDTALEAQLAKQVRGFKGAEPPCKKKQKREDVLFLGPSISTKN